MTIWRDGVAWLLLILATACFVAGLLPHRREWVEKETGDEISELRIGLWFSPVFEKTRREFHRNEVWDDRRGVGEARKTGWETQSSINWLSWSALTIVAGFVGLMLHERRRIVVERLQR